MKLSPFFIESMQVKRSHPVIALEDLPKCWGSRQEHCLTDVAKVVNNSNRVSLRIRYIHITEDYKN
jgi:hypothetical protein